MTKSNDLPARDYGAKFIHGISGSKKHIAGKTAFRQCGDKGITAHVGVSNPVIAAIGKVPVASRNEEFRRKTSNARLIAVNGSEFGTYACAVHIDDRKSRKFQSRRDVIVRDTGDDAVETSEAG